MLEQMSAECGFVQHTATKYPIAAILIYGLHRYGLHRFGIVAMFVDGKDFCRGCRQCLGRPPQLSGGPCTSGTSSTMLSQQQVTLSASKTSPCQLCTALTCTKR